MHQRPLAIPAPDRVVQEHDAGRGDKVHHHAGVHRKGAVDEQERAAQQGRDHPSSVHESVSVRRRHARPKKTGTYMRESADAIPHAVPRTLVPKISGVHLVRTGMRQHHLVTRSRSPEHR